MEMMLTMNILAMEANHLSNMEHDDIVGSRGIIQTNDKLMYIRIVTKISRIYS